ncbi:hypothetical protein M501DRAFT_943021 [Patellaria atrata CBS 101060]|uniref:HSF-type DNA-binding domain-containing protein n=1 Tax=Patellaria atrata CBS 101060 TaxID=1346257 RepID=A0A9P4S2E2_9PEZI|nr:hypothetical protein M501DRAFT_943021 [Patellaria atrata CBS 101060]
MASTAESIRPNPFTADPHNMGLAKSIPILPSSSTNGSNSSLPSPGDPMDFIPTPGAPMGPPTISSPVPDKNSSSNGNINGNVNGSTTPATDGETTNGTNGPVGAAAAAQQPKVVQTAFIHKLYNMLEDQSIQHLISWSQTNESFVMSPSNEFSKVLSSYFKHTNISSFVRQLNMYGFHKVSDVFHTGSPDSPLWEFKHGNGSFKRGDLVGLREIKRRASRHALIHRDSFSTGPKVAVPTPGTPVEPMPDPVEARLSILEHNLYEVHNRLARSEDNCTFMATKCQLLSEGLMRCHQWNLELSNYIMAMVPDPDHQVHRDAACMQREISRQADILRSWDEPQDPLPSARQQYFGNLGMDSGPPISPRQYPQDDQQRRPSLVTANSRQGAFRPPAAPHLSISPRRYGSIGGASGNYSPSSSRPTQQPPPPPPPPPMHQQQQQHPLASVSSPPANLSRRHTSADIRLHGWNAGAPPPPQSPYASGQNSGQWPSSPHRTPISDNQQLRDVLAQYSFQPSSRSRQPTPPPSAEGNGENGWALPGQRYPFRAGAGLGLGLGGVETPGPPTRRSSMASNVHSLLNPAETAERADEEEREEDRKRKRVL